MRSDRTEIGGAGPDARCGGFRLSFEEGEAVVRLVPGQRRLAGGLTGAVLRGLSQAPDLLSDALRLRPPPRPYDRVEVALTPGEAIQGEALLVGAGCIRLSLGEESRIDDATRIARHEALHLLLASSLRAGERWNDPELAFADWIVRGIEGGLDPSVPRFHPPLPPLLEKVPTSRTEVQEQVAGIASSPAAAQRYFGEPLFTELQRIASEGEDGVAVEQRQLWLVEAALGTHYLEAAGRLNLEQTDALFAVVLDDWLLDYEQYARAVANPPSGAGNLWRLSEAGWSADPLTRLSVAAQALQRDDHCFFAGERYSHADEPVVWKNRGRVRLPLLFSPPKARPAPIHAFRVVLREVPGATRAMALVEEAVRSGGDLFEARALWPRILARLLAAELPAPAVEEIAPPVVQVVDSPGAKELFQEWSAAAAALRALLGDRAAWVPAVAEPQHFAILADAPRTQAAIALLHAGPMSAASLLPSRKLAALRPVRGSLFRDHLGAGAAHELLPDLEAPLDPRYREEAWNSSIRLPERLADLVPLADEATAAGRLTTPLSHLLAMMAIGLSECHYPRPRSYR